jgi:hypothetical protein
MRSDYSVRRNAGDSETAEVHITPCITCLVHHTIVLTIHALGSGTLAALAIINNGMLGRLSEVNLNTVERDGRHVVLSL